MAKSKSKKNYEITPLTKGIIVASVCVGLYFVSEYFGEDQFNYQAYLSPEISYSNNSNHSNTSTYVNNPSTNKVNDKVINYQEPTNKSPYVRKEHSIDVVNSTNYSYAVPGKIAENSQEEWVIDKIKSYSSQLPRVMLQDYGEKGYYVNSIGQDSFKRHILPGINPDGQWATILYSNTNLKNQPIKMELGHNWQKWKDQGYEVASFYASHKTVSLSNSIGQNITSSIYPINQSLGKGPVFNFK